MSAPSKPSGELITGKADLVAYLESGCKRRGAWRIGTEHEKFVFRRSDHRRVPYDGPDGIQALLTGLMRFGWSPINENGSVIALARPDGCQITLEPGGQLELSGTRLGTIHQTCAEVHEHLDQVKLVAGELGVGLIGLGFDPKWRREDIPWMPKQRYRIMRSYMPSKGRLGLDMMLRTCTVQVNLDYESEADMVRKYRISLALQPIVTALFANSPFTDGRVNGYMSYRSQVWTDTDPDRCGMLPFVFDDAMGFERYADYVLDVPMYFVRRDGRYIDASGQSFRDFMVGKLPALPGQLPTIDDWADHLTTLFPEVRLKQYLEQRGADGGPWRRLCALPALWVGLLYAETALDAAWDLVKDWTGEDRAWLRAQVPKTGLGTALRRKGANVSVLDVAREVVRISRDGLDQRARMDASGRTEAHFLDPLDRIVDCGQSPAAHTLRLYENEWGSDIEPIYQAFAY
ncbi:MAG: glutamate--cysteine ligase [Kiloniellales bacterium]